MDETTAAQAAPAADPPQPGPEPPDAKLRAYDLETISLINRQCEEIDTLSEDWVKKNAEAKKAKEEKEAANERLRRLIAERKAGRGRPVQPTLFDAAGTTEQADAARPPEPPLVEGEAAADPLRDLWRDFPVARLTNFGCTAHDVDNLREGQRKGEGPHPLATVGGVADYTANVGGSPGYERRLSDFKGVGTVAATRIERAMEEFFGWYNRGGKEEFARERGLLPPLEQPHETPTGPGEEGGGGGPEQHRGEPDGPDGESVDTDPFVPPEDPAGEYSLAGREDGAPE